MSKKFFFIGMLALLVASLLLLGCPPEAEPETVYITNTEVIHIDEVVSNESGLITALANDAVKVIELNLTADFVSLATVTEIPAGKTIILRGSDGKSLTPKATDGLAIKGTVYVDLGGILAAKAVNPVKIPAGGLIYVNKGSLSVDKPTSVNDGSDGTPPSVLATKVKVDGGTLTFGAGTTADEVAAALGYVIKGDIDASLSTEVLALKPSAAVAKFSGASLIKRLTIEANGVEDSEEALTIREGLTLTTTDTLATITGLTVNGRLMASNATLDAITALEVNRTLLVDTPTLAAIDAATDITGTGTLIGDAVVSAKAILIIESALKQVSLDTTAITGGLTIPANTARAFNGAAAPSGDVTIAAGGSVFLPASGSLTVAAGKTLTVRGTLTVQGTLAWTDNTSKVILLDGGSLNASKDGILSPKSGVNDGSGVRLNVGTSAAPGTATRYTSAKANGVITLTTATAAGNGTASAYVIGKSSFAVDVGEGTDANTGVTSTAASNDAAAGEIKAGAGSAVVLIGKS